MKSLVDLYLDNLAAPWPRHSAEAVIVMIRGAGVLDEFIKWDQPYFSLNGHAIVKIYTAHDWINVFFYHGTELSDPAGLLNPEGRSSMRRLQIFRDQAPPSGLPNLIHQAITLGKPSGLPHPG